MPLQAVNMSRSRACQESYVRVVANPNTVVDGVNRDAHVLIFKLELIS